jgi:hypothetical protein
MLWILIRSILEQDTKTNISREGGDAEEHSIRKNHAPLLFIVYYYDVKIMEGEISIFEW